mmetsp:Transcript_2357/g.6239  ORF Transcript_2357/g.6239 Transcript_2357/m.6239 type:complete len:200 (-) Transcript_2357:345-944(-)
MPPIHIHAGTRDGRAAWPSRTQRRCVACAARPGSRQVRRLLRSSSPRLAPRALRVHRRAPSRMTKASPRVATAHAHLQRINRAQRRGRERVGQSEWGACCTCASAGGASLLRRVAGDGDEVDAVAVARAVGQIVAQVRAVDADALAIWQHAHVVPVDLGVAERGPAVGLRLANEGSPVAALRPVEEGLACVAVEKGDLT